MAIRMRHPTLRRGWVTTYYEGRIKIIDGEIEIQNPKSVYILSRSGWQIVGEEHLSSTTLDTLTVSAIPPPEIPEPASTAVIETIEIPTIAWRRAQLNEYARKLRIRRPERYRTKSDLLNKILEKLQKG